MGMLTTQRTAARKRTDPDDAPHFDRDRFERAEIRDGKCLVRRAKLGRPKKDAPKEAVNIRLDPDWLSPNPAISLDSKTHL
jgi:uncharacterized protein (DUF4415 family)